MVIPWNALGVVGGAIVFVYDRTKDRRAKAKAAAEGVGPAPQFEGGEADISLFTTYRDAGVDGQIRHFDEDIKAGLLPLLDARGLRHVPPAELTDRPEEAAALAALGSFYMVVPLLEGQTSAGETVRTCQQAGGVVLGSLSLVTLPVAGASYPMLIAIGGPALAKSANAAGEFAVLSQQAIETAKTEPAAPIAAVSEGAAAADVDGIIEDVAKRANGAQKPAAAVPLANIFDAAKEASD